MQYPLYFLERLNKVWLLWGKGCISFDLYPAHIFSENSKVPKSVPQEKWRTLKNSKLYANKTGHELSSCTCFRDFTEYCVLNLLWKGFYISFDWYVLVHSDNTHVNKAMHLYFRVKRILLHLLLLYTPLQQFFKSSLSFDINLTTFQHQQQRLKAKTVNNMPNSIFHTDPFYRRRMNWTHVHVFLRF